MLARSTNSDYMESIIIETPWNTRGVNPVNLFLPEKYVTRLEFLIDYDEVRINSQPNEQIFRSAIYAKYTSLQSIEY